MAGLDPAIPMSRRKEVAGSSPATGCLAFDHNPNIALAMMFFWISLVPP
jgi:hypothetical protein